MLFYFVFFGIKWLFIGGMFSLVLIGVIVGCVVNWIRVEILVNLGKMIELVDVILGNYGCRLSVGRFGCYGFDFECL